MARAKKAEITSFLKEFKRLAQNNFDLVCRKKNLASIANLGITVSQAKDEILQLTYENYHSGPEKDRDRPKSNMWKFGTEVQGRELYIKLCDDFSFDTAKCISFHEAESKISYPHKKGSKQ